MASEAAADRTGPDHRVESATPDGVQREIKNGLPARAAAVTSTCIPPAWGGPLSEADYAVLAASWITPEIANEAMLRRVDTFEGREVICQKGKRDCAGMLITYYWPGEPGAFNYRVRRDNPDWTVGKDGKPKPDRKYLGPPNSGNRLYIPPGVTLEQLQDVTIPIAIVEGEKKALALWRLARYETGRPRFIPVAIAGVWNWRGKVGKANGTTFDSWWTMHGVRAIMTRMYHYAEGHGLWEEGRRSPVSKAKLGKKRYKYERRILSFDETARVLVRLEEPNGLIIETCIATGARISEVLGLKWRHVNLEAATIKIEQRVWRQDIGRPKSEDSKRLLGIGDLLERYRAKAAGDGATPDSFVFQQKRAPGKPLWDSGVRDALHQAAEDEGCDFPGLGPHSFRRANITWRQQVGGSAIEASKIAGHSDLEMTGEYTFVTPERQNELTRGIQQKLAEARQNAGTPSSAESVEHTVITPEAPLSLAETEPLTTIVQ
jgi:integrase